MRNTATRLIMVCGLLLAPAMAMAQTPKPTPCATAVGCGIPEPSAVPEFGLCLSGIVVGCWLLSLNRKRIAQDLPLSSPGGLTCESCSSRSV